MTAPDDLRALGEGFRILVDVGQRLSAAVGEALVLRRTRFAATPDEVERFLRAVLRAVRAVTEPQNKSDVTRWIGKFFKLDERLADEFYRRLVPSLNPSGWVERDKVKLIIDSAVERGLTDKPLDPDAVTDFSIVRQLKP